MRSRRSKSPPQGLFNWSDVVKYLEQIGALNKKYDSNLDGVVDKSADANTVGGHAPGTSAGDVLVLNTAGQVPLSNLPPIPDSQLDFSFAWEKVAEVTETGVASITFTGLEGDTDKYYMIIHGIGLSATTTVIGYISINSDTTIANYLLGGLGIAAWPSTLGASGQSFGATTGVAGIRFTHFSNAAPAFGIYFINAEGVSDGTNTYVIGVGICMNAKGQGDRITYGAWKKSAEVTSLQLFTNPSTNADWNVILLKPKW